MIHRCAECGSYGEQCAFDAPQPGCGCARCLAQDLWAARNALALERRAPDQVLAEVWAALEDRCRLVAELHARAEGHRAEALLGELHFLRNVATRLGPRVTARLGRGAGVG